MTDATATSSPLCHPSQLDQPKNNNEKRSLKKAMSTPSIFEKLEDSDNVFYESNTEKNAGDYKTVFEELNVRLIIFLNVFLKSNSTFDNLSMSFN